ncbi:HlyU family transcriptional regulator [Amaricoccus tamworthensis]|uniref:HlyU family transcriptional regulator n=1 Tax=Amaricoccus tamworthensis TaxID=57002 RepID=UPI003C7A1B84
MSLFSRLFGGSGPKAQETEPEIYKDFRIYAEPAKEGGSYRMSARIEKDIDGDTKTHMMIRADTFDSADTAVEMSTAKAKMLIDQQGVGIFS